MFFRSGFGSLTVWTWFLLIGLIGDGSGPAYQPPMPSLPKCFRASREARSFSQLRDDDAGLVCRLAYRFDQIDAAAGGRAAAATAAEVAVAVAVGVTAKLNETLWRVIITSVCRLWTFSVRYPGVRCGRRRQKKILNKKSVCVRERERASERKKTRKYRKNKQNKKRK